MLGFIAAGGLLLLMKKLLKEPKLYESPKEGDRPPRWVRIVLIFTCGGVSFAHGSNDGQKGMGILLLVLIGFMPAHYALNVNRPDKAPELLSAVDDIRNEFGKHNIAIPPKLEEDLGYLADKLKGRQSFAELAKQEEKDAKGEVLSVRWLVRQATLRTVIALQGMENNPGQFPAQMVEHLHDIRENKLQPVIEFVPLWVVFGTALALGFGTCIGYKRIVITVAEKIGKSHLTYGQGAAAETVAAATIILADVAHLPVSTTQILSSGVAGTMAANRSGIQGSTCRKILLAWVLTLPACMVLAGVLFTLGRCIVGP
jgi:phosphate/sulfate permease